MPSRDLEQDITPQSPLATDFARQQRQKQQGNNFHSTSIATMINPNSVNKTSLHPGGVEYVLHLHHHPKLQSHHTVTLADLLLPLDHSANTQISKKSSTKLHTSTMIASQLYVFRRTKAQETRTHGFIDRKSLSSCSVRRCARL